MNQTQRSTDYSVPDKSVPDKPVTVETLKTDLSNLATTVQKMASDQLGTAAGQVQDQAAQKVSDLEAAIRRNPTQAAVIAAGAGFLIGLVLTR